jgi:hypothetical protein
MKHGCLFLHQLDTFAALEKLIAFYINQHNSVASCERWLVNKEIIKALFDRGFLAKQSVISGHWALLKERAYVDSVAVACAEGWGIAPLVRQTDPLDPSRLVQRFSGSVEFLKRIWVAEKSVFSYSSHYSARGVVYGEFSSLIKDLCIPSVTHYLARDYLSKIGRMPEYPAAAAAIMADQTKWENCLQGLRDLVRKSEISPMSARQQP